MSAKRRHFVGARLRALRIREGLGQAAMAARLDLSVSYLSQLENDDRPLTPAVIARLAAAFPLDWRIFDADDADRRAAALREAIADPLFDGPPPPADALHRAATQQPVLTERFMTLHAAYRRAEERLQIIDDAISSGVQGSERLPWEEVRDWFHEAGNYIDPIDRAAEALAGELGANAGETAIIARLSGHHGIRLVPPSDDAPLRRLDRAAGTLAIDRALPPESRRFMLALQLAAIELEAPIAAVAGSARLRSDVAQNILASGLANYAAGALLMPYEAFRAAARAMRHDIDRLRQGFGVSFEQACHRLSTLQRPGARGIPFFFCRVDMAGNITKRHSATRLQFARFGGACPLWIVHEAVAIPDRILVQLAETPDGVRYVSMAKGLVKPSGSYARAPRRYAVALGCEAEHAAEFIYADGLDIASTTAATPIGISCRLCPRADCDQRAFPPADRTILVDPDVREVVPYRVS
ncbi:helix-turn-helix domain-containing protein [Sphingomonas sanxanigenens]|uniref:helix-turn-helix domain-containing protein n=1 Tax=Sphingomonas sanxanigenens TaxID=397260 RepID=UPI00046D4B7F|nr:helix-turn-helix transcriptional regulator [Sphingomonas sanxanigenens]